VAILSACAISNNVQPIVQASTNTMALMKTDQPVTSPTVPHTVTSLPTQEKTIAPTVPILTATPEIRITDPASVIKNYDDLLASFNQKMKTTGWIKETNVKINYDEGTKKYWDPITDEQWYRFDSQGQVVEAYEWIGQTQEVAAQESFFKGGQWYNITNGETFLPDSTQVDFSDKFINRLKMGEKVSQESVSYHDVNAWRFSSEFKDGDIRVVCAFYFDRDSNLIIGNETYWVEADGSLKLAGATTPIHIEINADPPLQRFQQIKDKAKIIHFTKKY